MENSGALDAILVVTFGVILSVRLLVVGVFRSVDDVEDETGSGEESNRDVRVVIDGCWTVTLTRGVTDVDDGGVGGGNKDVGVGVDEVLAFVLPKLHLMT